MSGSFSCLRRPARSALLCALALFMLMPRASAAQQVCSAEIQITNPKPTVPEGKLGLNVFSTVSKPAACLPAELRLMAAFYDADQNLICSGVIESIASQSNNTQSSDFEVRPFNVVEFVRLRAANNPPPKRLFCLNPE